jgi:hypothetical protein
LASNVSTILKESSSEEKVLVICDWQLMAFFEGMVKLIWNQHP